MIIKTRQVNLEAYQEAIILGNLAPQAPYTLLTQQASISCKTPLSAPPSHRPCSTVT
jgi:hypothetical protein